MLLIVLGLFPWGLIWPPVTHAQAADDSVDQDYKQELPRIPPKSPAEAQRFFHVQPGFRIELVAAEPLVTDPIALGFDERNRLYVVEMLDYSEDDKANLGRIRLLEDTDGDGLLDRSTVFVDQLSWPTALACYDGGLFVAAAPHLYYFKDTDGDGAADQRKLLFSGFERSNVQGLVNSFQWGLDNRIHGATSSSGAQVVKGPDHPEYQEQNNPALVLRGRDFAIDPRTLEIVATSGGAQHGMSFDDWGNKFVCHNSDHIQLVMFDDRYVARNPFLAPPASRLSIAVEGPQADVFRTSPVEPWRLVRTRLRVKGVIPGPVEGGGSAAGYFTSATGITIYRGDAWPAAYRGYAIVGDVGGNLIHRKVLRPQGVAMTAHRVDEKSEFVTSEDIWFRPVQFANGPDGALYVADMYREVIEHPASLHPVIKKHLDLTSGRDRGRIYRIVADNGAALARPALGQASSRELVAALASENGWTRDTAARLIYERQDRRAVSDLEQLATTSTSSLGRMHALYALRGLQSLRAETLLESLNDRDPRVREHAVRCAESLLDDARIRDRLPAMAEDPDPRVRYQLAFSLGELSNSPIRIQALARIVRRDVEDAWIPFAVRSSLFEGSGALLAELAANRAFRESTAGQSFLQLLAAQIGKQQRADDVAALLELLRITTGTDQDFLQKILQGLAVAPESKLGKQIAAATGGRAESLTAELVAEASATALQADARLEDRVAAAQLLRLGRFAALQPTLLQLLHPTQPVELQSAALAALSRFREPQVADLLLAEWNSLSPRIRSAAGDLLFSRPDWTAAMLDAVAAGQLSVNDLDPTRFRLLAGHADDRIRRQAEKLIGQAQLGRRAEVLETYRGALQQPGNADQGKEVFRKVCAPCHQLAGIGQPTGPNLATMRNRGAENILLNVLDPNREVNPQYLNYALITQDGRTLSGMIAAETANSVTLKRGDNATDTVLRIDIEQLKNTGLSLMPEGLEKQIDPQAMADLLAFLLSVE
jgi:putative membrane-bound dehydrogenase-like protein